MATAPPSEVSVHSPVRGSSPEMENIPLSPAVHTPAPHTVNYGGRRRSPLLPCWRGGHNHALVLSAAVVGCALFIVLVCFVTARRSVVELMWNSMEHEKGTGDVEQELNTHRAVEDLQISQPKESELGLGASTDPAEYGEALRAAVRGREPRSGRHHRTASVDTSEGQSFSQDYSAPAKQETVEQFPDQPLIAFESNNLEHYGEEPMAADSNAVGHHAKRLFLKYSKVKSRATNDGTISAFSYTKLDSLKKEIIIKNGNEKIDTDNVTTNEVPVEVNKAGYVSDTDVVGENSANNSPNRAKRQAAYWGPLYYPNQGATESRSDEDASNDVVNLQLGYNVYPYDRADPAAVGSYVPPTGYPYWSRQLPPPGYWPLYPTAAGYYIPANPQHTGPNIEKPVVQPNLGAEESKTLGDEVVTPIVQIELNNLLRELSTSEIANMIKLLSEDEMKKLKQLIDPKRFPGIAAMLFSTSLPEATTLSIEKTDPSHASTVDSSTSIDFAVTASSFSPEVSDGVVSTVDHSLGFSTSEMPVLPHTPEDILRLLKGISPESIAKLLQALSTTQIVEMLKEFTVDDLIKIKEGLSPDEFATLKNLIPPEEIREIKQQLSESDLAKLKELSTSDLVESTTPTEGSVSKSEEVGNNISKTEQELKSDGDNRSTVQGKTAVDSARTRLIQQMFSGMRGMAGQMGSQPQQGRELSSIAEANPMDSVLAAMAGEQLEAAASSQPAAVNVSGCEAVLQAVSALAQDVRRLSEQLGLTQRNQTARTPEELDAAERTLLHTLRLDGSGISHDDIHRLAAFSPAILDTIGRSRMDAGLNDRQDSLAFNNHATAPGEDFEAIEATASAFQTVAKPAIPSEKVSAEGQATKPRPLSASPSVGVQLPVCMYEKSGQSHIVFPTQLGSHSTATASASSPNHNPSAFAQAVVFPATQHQQNIFNYFVGGPMPIGGQYSNWPWPQTWNNVPQQPDAPFKPLMCGWVPFSAVQASQLPTFTGRAGEQLPDFVKQENFAVQQQHQVVKQHKTTVLQPQSMFPTQAGLSAAESRLEDTSKGPEKTFGGMMTTASLKGFYMTKAPNSLVDKLSNSEAQANETKEVKDKNQKAADQDQFDAAEGMNLSNTSRQSSVGVRPLQGMQSGILSELVSPNVKILCGVHDHGTVQT